MHICLLIQKHLRAQVTYSLVTKPRLCDELQTLELRKMRGVPQHVNVKDLGHEVAMQFRRSAWSGTWSYTATQPIRTCICTRRKHVLTQASATMYLCDVPCPIFHILLLERCTYYGELFSNHRAFIRHGLLGTNVADQIPQAHVGRHGGDRYSTTTPPFLLNAPVLSGPSYALLCALPPPRSKLLPRVLAVCVVLSFQKRTN